MEHSKEWLTPAEFAVEYGICKSTQAKMRMKKTLPYSKVGNFVRYHRPVINKWLEDSRIV